MSTQSYPLPEQDFPLPLGYERESEGFQRAFVHAKRFRNSDKAAIQYATAHADDFEDGAPAKRGRGRSDG